MDIAFTGEHLLPGKLGHFFALLALVAALFSLVSYIYATHTQDKTWHRMARTGFYVHGGAVLGIIVVLFYIIASHYFEYKYAWQHSSTDLPVYYLLSCFWEGQEGSFLLWSFWHVLLGFVLIRTARSWESPVMAVISLTQVVLASMLIGIYFFDYKIGSSPFVLLRNEMTAPIFSRPNYLDLIQDGNGLNPLLQNYWMVIHPPTLFLGFASTVIPFAYAVAGVWTKRYEEWIKPVLPWVLFSGGILGLGVLMGAAWAYEALSFGGYWAWDPVENASLVPWLTLIAGLHTLLAFKHSGHALRATVIFFVVSFFLVLYSTFLTRSGILGDSSVHSFTDLGMSGQLLVFIIALMLPAIFLIVTRYKEIPSPKKDEALWSREFWMFIGSLVFLLSMIQISFTTSYPVFNALFGTNLAAPTDVIEYYNAWQLGFGLLIALLSGFGQYFNYKDTALQLFWKRIWTSVAVAVVVTVAIYFLTDIRALHHILLMFCLVFSVVANSWYMFSYLKGKLAVSGGSITHVGFSLMLLGILFSGAQKEVISINRDGRGFSGFTDEENRENILLIQGTPTVMSDYLVTYIDDSTEGHNRYFRLKFERMDKEGKIDESFMLFPNMQKNENTGDVPNPDTRHYFSKDVYTHITAVSLDDEQEPVVSDHTIEVGDTIGLDGCYMVLVGFNSNPANPKYEPVDGDIAVGAKAMFYTPEKNFAAEPVYVVRNMKVGLDVADRVEDLGITIRLIALHPESNSFTFQIAQVPRNERFVTLRAIVFPQINVLWLGCVIMVLGFMTSMVNRIKQNRRSNG